MNAQKKKSLLIIGYRPSANTEQLFQAIINGTSEFTQIEVEACSPFDCNAEQVLKANAIILFTTENFGYMSGALKHFFEQIYYPCLEQPKENEGKPFALIIRAGLDGTGTDIAVHKITTGLKWKEVQPVTLCHGEYQKEFATRCFETGQIMAASLDNDLI